MSNFSQPLPQPPGARASFHLGLWSLLSNLLLLLPVSIGLGIAAIVTNRRAAHRAEAAPGTYQKPASTGLILGIVGLCIAPVMLVFLGIISAIAIPALLGQRGRARDKAVVQNLLGTLPDLMKVHDKGSERNAPPDQVHQELDATLQTLANGSRNPWNQAQPAFEHRIQVCEGLTPEGVREAAEARATDRGTAVFVIQFRTTVQAPGYLAGAVRTQMPINGRTLVSKVVELD